jgi:hypothetical protein
MVDRRILDLDVPCTTDPDDHRHPDAHKDNDARDPSRCHDELDHAAWIYHLPHSVPVRR